MHQEKCFNSKEFPKRIFCEDNTTHKRTQQVHTKCCLLLFYLLKKQTATIRSQNTPVKSNVPSHKTG